MAICVFECVHVCGAGRVCGVRRPYAIWAGKLAMRELWTGEPTNTKKKVTGNVKNMTKGEKRHQVT